MKTNNIRIYPAQKKLLDKVVFEMRKKSNATTADALAKVMTEWLEWKSK